MANMGYRYIPNKYEEFPMSEKNDRRRLLIICENIGIVQEPDSGED